MRNKREKNYSRFRTAVQIAAAAFFNGWAKGYFKGTIYTGNSKVACVPVLNCYSCPGAWGSCPIGSMQAVVDGGRHKMSFYVTGIIMLFGLIFGRFICGFLCPFGLIQDLLYKIKTRKVKIKEKIDRPLRYLKYIILLLFVILLPTFAVNDFGMSLPYFCKYICPAGTLGAGLPLVAMNRSLQNIVGSMFQWKVIIMLIILAISIIISRPFCKYICPLGAIYSLFNRFSMITLELDENKCISCGKCAKKCPMDIDPVKDINSTECIKCGVCKSVCPAKCIDFKRPGKKIELSKSINTCKSNFTDK